MSQHLTDKIVEALPRPASGNRVTYDGGEKAVRGFGARVTAGGARSFVFNYRADGRERRITIGPWPAWKVKAARDEAANLRRRVDMGEDPMAERHADRAAPTIEALAERYLAEYARPRKRARTVKDDESLLRQLIVPKLGRLRVDAVRRHEIEAFHRQISATTPIRANRCLALLSKMFGLAVGWEIRADNPCARIERNQEEKRERYLSPAELQRLITALADHPQQSRANVIRLLLLTGSRRGEVLGATWDQFDLEAGVWTKPAASTKQKKLHRVPLSAPARQLLSEMKEAARADVLFPGQQPDLKRFWEAICKAADIKGARMHDLRHSYASYLASAGMSLPIIGALLGHTQASTTQRYAHLLDDPLRAATERVGAMMAGAGKPRAEVVTMQLAKAR
jgi:integrase